jgi:hypothetical protein
VFERFTEQARQVVVYAQEEARLLRHPHIGDEHLLLGIARVEPALLGLPVESVRPVVVEVCGPGERSAPGGRLPFTPRAKKALELGLRNALRLGHNYIGAEHLLLGVLQVEHTAGQVIARLGLAVDPLVARAEALAGGDDRPLRVDALAVLESGDPLAVYLGESRLPIGDFGNPRVDARLLLLMLRADTRMGRWLRSKGIDEDAVLAEVPTADDER